MYQRKGSNSECFVTELKEPHIQGPVKASFGEGSYEKIELSWCYEMWLLGKF